MGALDGKVAIVTGAGRGIGREHALLLAKEGATVVVNDLGADATGAGGDLSPAAQTVKDIESLGGTAMIDGSDVSDWDAAGSMIDNTVKQFKRLDILVNNAGILRDAFLASMSEAQWDAVIQVHLKGHAAPLRHAAAYWKQQSKAGEAVSAAVVNTASASGTFMPNAGQANYGAAKAGIAALSLVAADELQRYGVRVNCIAPIARTRLTVATPGMGAIFAAEVPEGEFDALGPQNISPLVTYLVSDACELTGKVFAVQGGNITELVGWTAGKSFDNAGPWTLENVAQVLQG